jgi:hypothetical protein
MSKIKKNKSILCREYIQKYSKEFSMGVSESLFCNLCCTTIDFSRKSSVDSHRNSKRHQSAMKASGLVLSDAKQEFLTDVTPDLTKDFILTFLEADIPLSKLNRPRMKNFFKKLNYNLPSVTSARRMIGTLAKDHQLDLKKYFEDKRIFIIADESEIRSKKYFNILAGDINSPKIIYAIDCLVIENNMNSITVKNLIEDSISRLNIDLKNFILFISDAARYMVSAGDLFKMENKEFFISLALLT